MWLFFLFLAYFGFFGCLTEAHIFKRQAVERCSPSGISSITFSAICYNQIDGKRVDTTCTEPVVPNTIAEINCKFGYERTSAQSEVSICNSNGQWSPPPIECTEICGLEAADRTPLIISGYDSNIRRIVPWHVGIYRKVDKDEKLILQCGGTIISSKVIVSAAHCFWSRSENELNSFSDFRVVAGKFYRDLNDPREKNTYQMFSVKQIHLEAGYLDYEGFFANDLAVVILDKHIEFKVNVAPVCIERYEFDERTVPAGAVGRVAGWGLVEPGGNPSDTLKQIDLLVVQRSECIRKLNSDFRPFLTIDKFCAGNLTDANVCLGDAGGGLVIRKLVNGRYVFYLRGVLSSGQNKDGSCDNNNYALYANTAYFWDLIEYHLIANRPSVNQSTTETPTYLQISTGRVGGGCTATTAWECTNMECIDTTQHCDGKEDCSDGSDELACPSVAP